MVFGAWWGNKYDDNSRALFEYVVKNRSDIKAYWFSSNKDIVKQVKELGYPVVYSHSFKAIYISLRTGYELYSTSNNDIGENLTKFLGGCTLINFWHGIPLKKIMYDNHVTPSRIGLIGKIDRIIENIAKPNWYVICTSEFYHKVYQSAFRKDSSKILNLGQVRNDYLFNNLPNQYRDKYKGKKIIVYMPTHRQEGRQEMNMYNILNLQALDTLMNVHNAILLIKKHYYHRNEINVGDEYNNIKEVTHENPEAYIMLSAADILISDYSGAFIDYLLLKRPQLFFCYDFENYVMNEREMYVDYFSNAPGPICKNNDQLIKELEKMLMGKDEFVEKRQQQLDFYFSKENQGIVAPKQLEVILSL